MTQEDKELLLKDLSARLPYRVKVIADIDKTFDGGCIGIVNKIEPYVGDKFPELKGQYLLYEKGCLTPLVVDEVRPYLRPLSSMTEEEKKEAVKLGVCYDGAFHNDVYDVGTSMEQAFTAISWLLQRHFDINHLIEKGLALEAPEGNKNI